MSSFVLTVCACGYVFADFVTKIVEFITPHIRKELHKLTLVTEYYSISLLYKDRLQLSWTRSLIK